MTVRANKAIANINMVHMVSTKKLLVAHVVKNLTFSVHIAFAFLSREHFVGQKVNLNLKMVMQKNKCCVLLYSNHIQNTCLFCLVLL